MNPRTLLSCLLAAAALSACASFSPDGGFGEVERTTRERTGHSPGWQRTESDTQAASARVAELLAKPLDADGAVEIALIDNKGLQASFAELGIAEADLVRAGRLPNPSLRFGRVAGAGTTEIDRAVLFDVLGLFTLPLVRDLEQDRFEQVRLQAAYDAVGVASQARTAYFQAVAAAQLLSYFEQVRDAADASSELARQMAAAGNFSKLSQMREEAFHGEASVQLARARHEAVAARERLVRVLGLSADAAKLQLPQRLPDLPAQPTKPVDAQRIALEQRLDVLMARRSVDATARSLGLTRRTGFVNVLQAGYQNKSTTGEATRGGYEIEFELPLFDFGSTRSARAQAVYMQALDRAAQVAVDAGSQVREAQSAYDSAYEAARRYRDEIVPLRRRISEENLLRYNGMLVSVFDLLADSREQIASVAGSVASLRDFWVAQTNLQTALTGRSPPDGSGPSASMNARQQGEHQ